MILKPQDILVLLKWVARGSRPWAYAELAVSLGMSPSQLHAATQRVLAARLADKREGGIVVNTAHLEEFLVHGLKYVFVPERGELTRGMPTAHAAAPLRQAFAPTDEPPPVWPDPQGEVRGQALSPIYKFAPQAARADAALYELLVLVDAIRGGRAREREIAVKELQKRLAHYA